MRALLKACQTVGYFLSFALFAVLSFALNCICLGLGWLPGFAGRERFFQRLIHRDFSIFVWWLSAVEVVKVRYDGFERWPRTSRLVVAANHPGLMDVGWLLARVPEAICIYKPSVGHNPLFGATARCGGYLPNNCGHHLLRSASAKIAAGHTLLVFPEGTRSKNGKINPLKPGFVAMARMASAPIQLVTIAYDGELLSKAHAWWRAPSLPVTVTVKLGPCLPPPGDDTSTIVDRIEAWFQNPDAQTDPNLVSGNSSPLSAPL